VTIVNGSGAYGGRWYACKPTCIKKAVMSTGNPNRDADLEP
jgi:hypothetical protein